MRRSSIQVICLLITIFSLTLPAAAQVERPLLYPDEATRQMASQTHAKDVACLRFYGLNFRRAQDDPIEVRDEKAITIFLNALRQANTTRGGFLLGDIVEVSFRPSNGQQRSTYKLRYNSISPALCVNSKFANALEAVLGPICVQQVRRLVYDNRGKVKAIDLYGRSHILLTKPDQIEAVLKEIAKVDVSAFIFTKPPRAEFYVYLHFRADYKDDLDETAIRIPLLAGAPLKPKSINHSLLPSLLWHYYNLPLDEYAEF